jgi:hypothetical protein
MSISQMIAIGVVVIIAIAIAAWFVYQRNRSRHLREHFGPEYDRRVTELGDRRRAESELARSEARVRNLKIRALTNSDRARFREEWRLCQARFVDDPAGAVTDADRVLTDIMRARGYAVDDPSSRTTDITAAYPNHALEYREANDIVIQHHSGLASTEDLRRAFIDFRSLFEDILGGRDEELKRAS